MPQCPWSCTGHSVLNVTFPSRAGSRRSWAGRDCSAPGREVPEAPEPRILLQGHLLTFRATGSAARGLCLHSLQQGSSGTSVYFHEREENATFCCSRSSFPALSEQGAAPWLFPLWHGCTLVLPSGMPLPVPSSVSRRHCGSGWQGYIFIHINLESKTRQVIPTLLSSPGSGAPTSLTGAADKFSQPCSASMGREKA